MSHAPEECLTSGYAIDTKSDRNAEHVYCVQKSGGDAIAALYARTLKNCRGNQMWIARFKAPVGSEMQVDANVRQREKRARRKWDWAVLVLGVE